VTAGALGLDLLAGAATVLAAIVAARLAHGVGLPALLVFLGLGLALGESGLGIKFDNAALTETLGLAALVLILAEGGLTTNWAHARRAAPAAIALATVGVVVSIGVVGAGAHWLLHLGWREALLLGAVLAPTDAAAVFSVLRTLPLPPRLSGMLEGESGLNDPPSVLAVTLLSQHGAHGPDPLHVVGEVAWELVGGAAIGASTRSPCSRSSSPATAPPTWPGPAGSLPCTPPPCSSATCGSRTARRRGDSPRRSAG
jgi:potassium/hydrogen antiporter